MSSHSLWIYLWRILFLKISAIVFKDKLWPLNFIMVEGSSTVAGWRQYKALIRLERKEEIKFPDFLKK